jgi:hypothetical protein
MRKGLISAHTRGDKWVVSHVGIGLIDLISPGHSVGTSKFYLPFCFIQIPIIHNSVLLNWFHEIISRSMPKLRHELIVYSTTCINHHIWLRSPACSKTMCTPLPCTLREQKIKQPALGYLKTRFFTTNTPHTYSLSIIVPRDFNARASRGL